MRNSRASLCSIHKWARRIVSLTFALTLTTIARAQLQPEPRTVRIGVLSLFHSRTLTLTADHRVTLLLDGAPSVVDSHRAATFRATAGGVTVDQTPVHTVILPPEIFTLTVPGKLTRTYSGALAVTARSGILVPVVTMDTETAVASIVAAEAPPHAPLEALKAQAVASRSFLLASRGVHAGFDACDTTHCQYLRSPPPATSPAAIATRATRNMVLTWRASAESPPSIVAAMYSRSCGGHTRVPPGRPQNSYPFYSVRCEYCLRHPELWSRPAGTPEPATEQERLAWNRTHGWSAIPSNTHTEVEGELEGRGTGHGIGLCQLGAADLAARGSNFQEILAHYFPNTTVSMLP